jgi:hypothetical protein
MSMGIFAVAKIGTEVMSSGKVGFDKNIHQ